MYYDRFYTCPAAQTAVESHQSIVQVCDVPPYEMTFFATQDGRRRMKSSPDGP